MRVERHLEGMVLPDGVSYSEGIHFCYVCIRRGNNILEIAFPKKNPKDYSLNEYTLNKWDQKLWL